MGLMIAIPRNVIAAISTPLLAQAWKRNDISQIEEIYKKSSLNLLIVGCFLFLLIWCNLDFIYQIIPRHEVYETGKWVVLMVLFSQPGQELAYQRMEDLVFEGQSSAIH